MGVQGGIFQLITRDGRNDQFLQAESQLRARLDSIKQKRAAARAQMRAAGDPKWESYPIEPTLADVECSHRLFVRSQFRPFCAVGCEYAKVPAAGIPALSSSETTLKFTLPVFGDFLGDMVLHLQLAAVGTEGGAGQYEYTHYPGIRAVRRAEFRSDEVLIDSYSRDDVLFVDKFWVDPKDRDGWDRCMGEQVTQVGEFWNSNEYTACAVFKDGAQTRRARQAPLDLWIPLQFSTAGDAAQAIPNDMIPNTQRTVSITLAPVGELIRARDAAGNVVSLPFSTLAARANLYVNNLYVNPEIHDIFAARLGFTLIRTHQTQYDTLSAPAGVVRLDRIKFPAEFLQVGVRSSDAEADFDRWHLFGQPRARTPATSLMTPGALWNVGLGICQLVCRQLREASTLDEIATGMRVTAGRGVELFTNADATFYQAYLPTRWRGRTPVVAPKDRGVMLVPFDLYPGAPEVSGYINLSTEREVQLEFVAPTVSGTNTAQIISAASALNFLVRDGDSIRLRYST